METLMKLVCSLSIALLLAANSALAAEKGTLSKKDQEFAATLERVLKAKPELVEQAQQALLDKRAQQAHEMAVTNERAIGIEADDPMSGGDKGDVSLIMFYQYDCEPCREASKVAAAVLGQDPNVRLFYKDLPLSSSLSVEASLTGQAIARQGIRHFEVYHYTLARLTGPLSKEQIEMAVRASGVDLSRLRRDLNDPALKAKLERNRAMAAKLHVSALPSFVIGGAVVKGIPDPNILAEAVTNVRFSQRMSLDGGNK
jgi:protein-disulfide isomerase